MCECGCFTTTFESFEAEGTVAVGAGFDVTGSVFDASAVIPAGQPGGPELEGTGFDAFGSVPFVADPSAPMTALTEPAFGASVMTIGPATELSTPMALAGLMDLPGIDATDKATLAGIINANLAINDRILAPSHDIFGNPL